MSFAAIASPNEMDHSLVNNKIIINAAITGYLPALGLMPYNLARIKLLQLNSML